MSEYHNWISDFPSRCGEILDGFNAEESGREVTLLLAVASAAICIPRERLERTKHMSGDSKEFQSASGKHKKLLRKPIRQLFKSFNPDEWRFGKVNSTNGDPDAWAANVPVVSGDGPETKVIVDCVRNALAHGNLWTRGNPIDEIVLASRIDNCPRPPYRCLIVSYQQLKAFVVAWINHLEDLVPTLSAQAA